MAFLPDWALVLLGDSDGIDRVPSPSRITDIGRSYADTTVTCSFSWLSEFHPTYLPFDLRYKNVVRHAYGDYPLVPWR